MEETRLCRVRSISTDVPLYCDENGVLYNPLNNGYLFTHKQLETMLSMVYSTIRHYERNLITDADVEEYNNQRDVDACNAWDAIAKANSVPEDREGFVYLMLDTVNDFVKIGFSTNPRKRERTLQSEKPSISIVANYQGRISDERRLHEMFAARRVRGEWFDLYLDDLETIAEYFRNKHNG